MKYHTHLAECKPYTTKDGSEIRELLHPNHGTAQQHSLAMATVSPGITTHLHRHKITEEFYFIVAGKGRMTLGSEVFAVMQGNSICIPPGTEHCIENTGNDLLMVLCSCSPAYGHGDTELL